MAPPRRETPRRCVTSAEGRGGVSSKAAGGSPIPSPTPPRVPLGGGGALRDVTGAEVSSPPAPIKGCWPFKSFPSPRPRGNSWGSPSREWAGYVNEGAGLEGGGASARGWRPTDTSRFLKGHQDQSPLLGGDPQLGGSPSSPGPSCPITTTLGGVSLPRRPPQTNPEDHETHQDLDLLLEANRDQSPLLGGRPPTGGAPRLIRPRPPAPREPPGRGRGHSSPCHQW